MLDIADMKLERPASVAAKAPPARAAARPWLAEARALFVLAAPLVVTQLAQMAIFTTDTILLGRFSTEALAAAAIGNTVYYFAWLVGGGPAAAVAPMIAQLKGAKPRDRAGVRKVVRMGLWSTILVTLPLIPLMLSAGPILSHLGQAPQLAADAGRYTAMLCIGLPFALAFQVLRNFATALSHPRPALFVVLASIAWNGLFGWALIFGHFGAPRLGIIGAGLAASSSSVFGALALLAAVCANKELAAYGILKRFFRPAWKVAGELVRLGLPIGAAMIFEAMLFNAMTLVMGTFGPDALAAHQVAMNVASITFMAPLGLAMAATVRVGLYAGAGDAVGARRAGLTAMGAAMAFMGLSAIGMALAARPLAALYIAGHSAADREVISLAATFLLVAAAFQVFDGLQVVGALCLRGLKDARAPMVIAAASYWLAGAPVCIGLGVFLHMQGLGVWIGMAFGLAVAAILLVGRFHLMTRERPA